MVIAHESVCQEAMRIIAATIPHVQQAEQYANALLSEVKPVPTSTDTLAAGWRYEGLLGETTSQIAPYIL